MAMTDRTIHYMSGAIAPSTAKSYDSALKHWTTYATSHALPLLPVSPIDLGNCLSALADSTGSLSTITTVVAAVARQHWDRFLPSPTENFAFRRLLQGFKRFLSKPPKPKSPLTPEILSSAIALVRDSGRLQEWRTVVRMCLAFYAGCRWSDAIVLKTTHLSFESEGVSILIPRSKTDQFSRGESVFIRYAEHSACPVQLLVDYLRRLNYGEREGFLQPRIRTVKGVQSGIFNTQVSYSTALSDLRLLLASLGMNLDPSKFGEHSGRRGGATAASDAGVDWTDLMSHGRWKSIATPLGYLANSRRRQRRVAQALSKSHSSAPGSLDGASTSPVDILARRAPALASSSSSSTPRLQLPKKSGSSKKITLPATPVLSPVRLVSDKPVQRRISVPSVVRPPPAKRFAFESDWTLVKQRFEASVQSAGDPVPHRRFRSRVNVQVPSLPMPMPRSDPIPIPSSRTPVRASPHSSPPDYSSVLSPDSLEALFKDEDSGILSPSTVEALFGADDSFELMIL